MKNRFFILVGLLIAEMNLCQGGMTWEEWTPENGIEDGRAALQEMLDAGKIPDENWQEKALAFINAFEKLKLQLQFFWRSQVGDGAINGYPWNGIPGEVHPWEKQGYIKQDCPIILHFWGNGHIGQYEDNNTGFYSCDCFFPSSAMLTDNQKKGIKGKLKKYVYQVFQKKDLKKCAVFLNQNFCRPVSKIIGSTIENLKKQNILQKQELNILFSLYGVYDIIDFKFPIVIQENHGQIEEAICTFVANCCYDMSQMEQECKLWIIDLFKNYNSSPYQKDAGIGQYNLNLTNILQKIITKLKMTPKVLDEEFVRVMNIVIEEWQKQIEKVDKQEERNKSLRAWFAATNALSNAIGN